MKRLTKALAATLCLLAGVALAAPVPRAKPAAAPPLAGEWQCVWGLGTGTMTFDPLGGYCHRLPSSAYVGSWHLAGDGSVVVRERHVGADGTLGGEMAWSFLPAWDAKAGEFGGTSAGDYAGTRLTLRPKKREGR